ncbi:MAG TPA: ABC transporter ATP-binding protein [Stellaceae bacterium]|nr:ABC transporter ATP-binding protein [Stellaceae bacterium]
MDLREVGPADGTLKVHSVCKDYPSERGGYRRVLSDVSFGLSRGEKIAVLGRNGAGKSTLIRLLGGIELPSSGTIERTMSISWPIGLTGGVHGVLTGNDNIRFIARIYGKPFVELRDYVDDFAQLGKFLSEPVKTYSTGMAGRLNFALSLAVDFDCYLIDEVMAAGDQSFQRRSHEELFEKRSNRSLIMASHIPELVRSYCSRALVLHRGRGKVFDDLDLALDIYSAL